MGLPNPLNFKKLHAVIVWKGFSLPLVVLTLAFLSSCEGDDSEDWYTDNFAIEDFKIGDSPTTYHDNFINIRMPYGAQLTRLKPSFKMPRNATAYVGYAKQTSGQSEQNFNKPIEYRLVGEDGQEKTYVVTVSYSDLPILYISTPSAITSKETWVENSTIYLMNAGEYDQIYENANLRGRGNTTWKYVKKPYAIKLDKKAEVLGMPKHKRWVLLANYIDRTCMRNAAAFEIGRKATGLAWTPRGTFVDVVLNGAFMGNYYLCEQIKVDKNRVAIEEMKSADIDEEGITGGYLLELDTYFDEVNKFRTKFGKAGDGNEGMPVNIKDPDEEVLVPAQFYYIEDYFYKLESLLYASDFPAKGEYRDLIDMNSFIDWWLVNEVVQCGEPNWPKSSYMHKNRNGKLCAGPLWDYDWGTFKVNSNSWRIPKAIYYEKLLQDPAFVSAAKERWALLKANLKDIETTLDNISQRIKPSVEYNNRFWVATTTVNGDESLSYDEAFSRLKKSIVERIAWIDNAIKKL